MPSAGLQIFGAGLRLQASIPGVTDSGNAHVSGVFQSDAGARPFFDYPKATTFVGANLQSNILMGMPAAFTWGTGADDIKSSVFVGVNSQYETNPNGTNIADGVNIGSNQWCKELGGVCIGGYAENGTSGAYPLASNYNVIVGYGAKGWSSWGSTGGDTIVGANSKSGVTRASAPPANISAIFGFQQISSGAGKNILVGAKNTTTFKNSIIILNNGTGGIYNGTQDNQIKIGDETHTLIELGPINFNKPTITGAKGGNAALADLLTKLAAMNLIVDATT